MNGELSKHDKNQDTIAKSHGYDVKQINIVAMIYGYDDKKYDFLAKQGRRCVS